MAEPSKQKGTKLELTQCEERVFAWLLRGETNKEIAQRLGCTSKNIEFHVSNILRKAGQPSRVRLLAAVAEFAQGSPQEHRLGAETGTRGVRY